MKIDYEMNKPNPNLSYTIQWNIDPLVGVKSNVENFNDFKEAQQIIDQIKARIKNS